MEKGFAHVFVLILVVLGIGTLGYYSWKKGLIKPWMKTTLTKPYNLSEWQTYTDKDYNYTFKYPTNFALGSITSKGIHSDYFGANTKNPVAYFSIDNNKITNFTEEWIKNFYFKNTRPDTQTLRSVDLLVDNIASKYFEFKNESGKQSVVVFIDRKETTIIMEFQSLIINKKELVEYVNQILSTFKFTE